MAADKVTLDRIKFMHPKVREELLNDYNYINDKLLGKGVRLRFAYTYRSPEEQNALYAQGRTKLFDSNGKRLGKVTNAKAWQSIHNFSLAFDIVLLLDKDLDGNFESASWDTVKDFDKDGKSDWMEVVSYFKSKGWTWGGDFKSIPDAPHFQKDFGLTWQQMKSKIDKGDYTTEVVQGQTLKYIKI